MTRRTATILALPLMFVVLVLGSSILASAQDEEAAPSLYDRLGGIYNIALVVDDFIDRIVENEVLNANPGIYAARKPERFAGLKFQLTSMVCQAAGGPCEYTGGSMKDVHVDMAITEADWEALAADFKASLDHFGVGAQEQDELFAIVGSTKGDIVTAGMPE